MGKTQGDRLKVFKSALLEIAYILAGALIIFLLFQVTLQNSIVDGSSMEPNLMNGDRLLVSKVSYVFSEPKRGDIVIFPSPYSDGREFIKRIIGLPGETVQIVSGEVRINGTLIDEPYLVNKDTRSYPATVIPTGEYFVMGDNRPVSLDSRQGWTVKRADINGKAWLVFYPFKSFGFAPNHKFADIAAGAVLLPIFILRRQENSH
ncbi:signal peptidase I [Dehalogenimonas etheniformans]|uniref:Signal peptidase I n=1 Tax=Dehalogenimonas etheniformans TaxID=1536648 RepID=A0A2P5P878_9CHLR|nr:signal peptidase I [Dehalogenimonas etheniformans]QNT76735.1 signal peptidase I [Dehalogenimonas etheniformans]